MGTIINNTYNRNSTKRDKRRCGDLLTVVIRTAWYNNKMYTWTVVRNMMQNDFCV